MRRSDMFQEVIDLVCRKGTCSVPTRPHSRIQFIAIHGGRSPGFDVFLTLRVVDSLFIDNHLWSVNNKPHNSIARLVSSRVSEGHKPVTNDFGSVFLQYIPSCSESRLSPETHSPLIHTGQSHPII